MKRLNFLGAALLLCLALSACADPNAAGSGGSHGAAVTSNVFRIGFP